MGVIVFGFRSYGRVDAHGGEYAQTQFFHLDFVPLIPRSSFWVTGEIDGQQVGVPIKLHLRSVVATYLRVWGAVGAIAAFATLPGVAGLVIGAALAAASAWSWTWRSLRGSQARLRSDFNAVAFGLRCEPERLTDDTRQKLRATMTTRWHARDAGRSPDDVARFGAKDVTEAVLAYGMLRLAAADRGGAGGEERAAADRLIAGTHDALPTGVGPYRESAPDAASAPIAHAVSQLAEARPRLVSRGRPAKPWLRDRPVLQFAGLALLSMIVVSMGSAALRAAKPLPEVTARMLDSTHAPVGHRVTVNVDAIVDPGISYDRYRGKRSHLLLGRIGDRLLPLVVAADRDRPEANVIGRLYVTDVADRSQPWISALAAHPKLDAATFNYYLEVRGPNPDRPLIVIAPILALGTLALWGVWIRARVRRFRKP